LVLLLVGLLALLPCAGRAQASTAGSGHPPATTVTVALPASPTAGAHRTASGSRTHGSRAHGVTTHALHGLPVDDARPPLTWCSVDGDRQMPGSGCSSHSYCGQQSQLPNAPPQPAAAGPTQLLPAGALPRPAALATLPGPDHAPDLHVLQVHRS
jgi:hypothetical protein